MVDRIVKMTTNNIMLSFALDAVDTVLTNMLI